MQRFRKIIFWLSIITIVLLLVLPFLIQALNLEFTSDNDETVFEGVRFFGIPIAVMLTLTGTIKQADTAANITAKVVLTIIPIFIFVLVVAGTALDGMCRWVTDKTLFVNRNDTSVKIVSRGFGCGAVDSTAPTYGVFKVTFYTPHLIRVSAIDTAHLDKMEWLRVDDSAK